MTVSGDLMIEALNLVSDVPVPRAESVLQGVWDMVQQVAAFILTILTIWAVGGRKAWHKWEAKKAAEAMARERKRTEQIRSEVHGEVEAVVAPMREQLDAIHHTTHVNSHTSDDPTVLDRLSEVGNRIESAMQVVGAVAANQASLSARLDRHEKVHHGVEPE